MIYTAPIIGAIIGANHKNLRPLCAKKARCHFLTLYIESDGDKLLQAAARLFLLLFGEVSGGAVAQPFGVVAVL